MLGHARHLVRIARVAGLIGLNTHCPAHGVLAGKKFIRHARRQNATGRRFLLVKVGDKMPLGHFKLRQFSVERRGSDQSSVDFFGLDGKGATNFTHRHHFRDGRNGFFDPFKILPLETIGGHGPASDIHQVGIGGLDGTNDDIIRAETLDLFLRLEADSFADGHEPNDAGHADKNAEHRQHGAHGMQQKTFDAQLKCAKPNSHGIEWLGGLCE